jgi:ABC-type transport system involved in multi-copper enzyme maturation permease subunit
LRSRTRMLWLLAAEFRKLVRPLVWGTALAIVAFCLLITWGAASNARAALASPRIPDVCAQAATVQCRQVIAHAHAAARAAAAATWQLAQPGEIGHVAAGMLASVPGLLLIALIAGGHWGGEWGSRTIRQLLCREGRRGRVLAAKWLSIWAAGVATLLVCYRVLAAAAPVIAAAAGLPPAHSALWAGLGSSVWAAGRAIVVLGLFAAVGTAAGTIGRGQLATAAVTIGSMLLALLAAGIAGIGQLSPATFVQAWMGFGPAGYLPTNFWSRFISGSEHTGQLAGLLGVLLTAAVAAVIARWRFAADVTA